MFVVAGPAWVLAAVFAVATLGVAMILRRRTADREVWRYDVTAAWLRGTAYLTTSLTIAAATGTLGTVRASALVLAGQSSSTGWIVATTVVTMVVVVGYWVLWPLGTDTHGRSFVFPDTIVFGLIWGLAQGLVYASVWLTFRRVVIGFPGARIWLVVTTIVVLAVFSGVWRATYWDVHVAPEHNVAEWNLRKIALVYGPNLVLTVIWVSVWSNLALWVALETVALLGSAVFMRFPTFRRPLPEDPTRPTLGPPPTGPVSLVGRIYVVTGGARGIGRATVRALAAAGAHVVVLDIDDDAAAAVVAEAADGDGSVTALHMDLGDLGEVRSTAATLRRDLSRLDGLVNNAGVFRRRNDTVDGRERTVAINHDGHHLLTRELLTLLCDSDGRIVVVSSDAHRQARNTQWDDESVSGFGAYRRSKLLLTASALELAAQCEDEPVTVNVVTPGALIPTAIFDEFGPAVRRLLDTASRFLPTPDDAAMTAVRVVSSPEVDGVSGWYWKNGRATVASALASDPEFRTKVWEEAQTRTALPPED